MATIENLLLELIDIQLLRNLLFKNLDETDIIKCSEALIGTRHEKYVTQIYLKPQLKIFASLDVHLKESLENQGWFQECHDFKLIATLWKEFKPLKGMNYLIIQLCSGTSHYIYSVNFLKKVFIKS